MKMGGGPKQFGVDAEQVPFLLKRIDAEGLRFEGFHLFSGSQNLKHEAIIESQQKSYALALESAHQIGQETRSINLGGGFGIPYFRGDTALDIQPIAENLNELADRLASELPTAHLTIELGRFLVGEAGIYVAKVLDRKVSRGHVFLVTDGGMHHHLAASGNFGQVIRKNYPVVVNRCSASTEEVSVVGPLCTPLDILADKVLLPKSEPNDLIVVFQSGAYGRSSSPREFLGHPDAPEALV
jgi:diaminopimelate decarboxylase